MKIKVLGVLKSLDEGSIKLISQKFSPEELKLVLCQRPKGVEIMWIKTEEFPNPAAFSQLIWALIENSDVLVIDGSFPSLLALYLAELKGIEAFFLGNDLIRLPRICPIKEFHRKLLAEIMRRENISTSELARRLGMSKKGEVQRLANALKDLEKAEILRSRKEGGRRLWSIF